jgi:hypothetical protein
MELSKILYHITKYMALHCVLLHKENFTSTSFL